MKDNNRLVVSCHTIDAETLIDKAFIVLSLVAKGTRMQIERLSKTDIGVDYFGEKKLNEFFKSLPTQSFIFDIRKRENTSYSYLNSFEKRPIVKTGLQIVTKTIVPKEEVDEVSERGFTEDDVDYWNTLFSDAGQNNLIIELENIGYNEETIDFIVKYVNQN